MRVFSPIATREIIDIPTAIQTGIIDIPGLSFQENFSQRMGNYYTEEAMAYNMGQFPGMDPAALQELAAQAALATASTEAVDKLAPVKADSSLPLLIGGGLVLFLLMRK